MQVIEFFDNAADRHPDKPFLVGEGYSHSHKLIQETSHRIARALLDNGFEAGDRVAVYSLSDVTAVDCFLGALRVGGVFLPLNTAQAVNDNLHALRQADCNWIFYNAEFRGHVDRIRQELPNLKGVICMDGPDGDAPGIREWLPPVGARAPEPSVDPDAPVLYLTTGGTTGLPKGVFITNSMVEAAIANAMTGAPPEDNMVNLIAVPITLAVVQILYLLPLAGAHVILTDFSPAATLEAIEKYKVTRTFVFPTILYGLLSDPKIRDFDYSSLKYVFYGGAPTSVDKLKEALDVFGPVMMQAYGKAEALSFVMLFPPEEYARALKEGNDKRLLSCGRPTMFSRVEVMDDEGNVLGPGEIGEIVIRSSTLMKHYHNNPEEDAKAFRNGWHLTSDVGYRDEEGFFYLVDRKRDLIIVGGRNVYPGEVEQLIMTFPEVKDCAVVGVADDKWGEIPRAVVEARAGHTPDIDAILQKCRDELWDRKVPRSIDVWESLPKSSRAKVLKRVIRDQLEEKYGTKSE